MLIITNSRICLALLIITLVRNRTHFLVIIISSILLSPRLILLLSKILTLFHRMMPIVLNRIITKLQFKRNQILLIHLLLSKLHKLLVIALSSKDRVCSICSLKSNRTSKLITLRISSLINPNKMLRIQPNRIPKVSRSLMQMQLLITLLWVKKKELTPIINQLIPSPI